MNKYKYQLTPVLWVLFIVGLILAGCCIYFNLTRFIGLFGAQEASSYSYISSLLSTVIGVLAFIFIPPAMFASKYVITDEHLIAYWGIVKNKFDVKEITTVTHFRKTDKLVIYFSDQSFTTIIISPELFDKFAEDLKSKNKRIFYQLNVEDSGEK